MRLFYTGITCLALVFFVGCDEPQQVGQADKQLDTELVNTLNNIQVENALITQHTIYPYYFVTDSADINTLGERDIAVLARHYKEHPGVLNVNRGKANGELYNARVAQVKTQLKEAGVDLDRMTFSDGLPGGRGIASDEIVTKKPEVTSKGSSSMGGSSGSLSR